MKTTYKLREITFYKAKADAYDKPADSPSLHGVEASRNIVAAFTSQLKDAVILDLGCGTGGVAVATQNCVRMIGIDLSSEMLQIAKSKTPNPKPEMDLVRADLFNLPLRDKTFDAAISMGVLGVHVPLTQSLLVRLHGLLKPRGQLLFHTNTFRTHWSKVLARRVFEFLNKPPHPPLSIRGIRILHFPVQPYAEIPFMLKRKLHHAGYEVEKLDKVQFAQEGFVAVARRSDRN